MCCMTGCTGHRSATESRLILGPMEDPGKRDQKAVSREQRKKSERIKLESKGSKSQTVWRVREL